MKRSWASSSSQVEDPPGWLLDPRSLEGWVNRDGLIIKGKDKWEVEMRKMNIRSQMCSNNTNVE